MAQDHDNMYLANQVDRLERERNRLRLLLNRIREAYAGAGSVAERFNEIGNILTDAD